jgi:hypothetical protein
MAQAFDKVWHEALVYKLELLLPTEYSQILKYYICKRYFRVRQKDEYSGLKPIKPGLIPNIYERSPVT